MATPMIVPVHIVKIDYSVIQAKQDSPQSDVNSFNSSFHPWNSLPPELQQNIAQQVSYAPNATGLFPAGLGIPTETPYSFSLWLPLILASRNLHPSSIQQVRLTTRQARVLLDATNASIQLQRVNSLHAEDVEAEIVPLFQNLDFHHPSGLWMRLDASSPKDGTRGNAGSGSLRSVQDIILRLVTSVRARNALWNALEPLQQTAPGQTIADDITLHFLPFDERMSSENEYRVYCSPGDLKIRGISQYRWHKRWKFAGLPEGQQLRIIDNIHTGAEGTRQSILKVLSQCASETSAMSHSLAETLKRQGMVFDLLYDEATTQCQLVELNYFGATSGCGACLFHWIKDWKQLYGCQSGSTKASPLPLQDDHWEHKSHDESDPETGVGSVVEFRVAV